MQLELIQAHSFNFKVKAELGVEGKGLTEVAYEEQPAHFFLDAQVLPLVKREDLLNTAKRYIVHDKLRLYCNVRDHTRMHISD